MKKKKNDNDFLALIGKIEEQLRVIEDKIDVLINKAIVPTPHGAKPALVVQQPLPAQNNVPKPQNNGFKKPMYKAVCADCRKECELPFRPQEGRPVFCKECFAIRRSGGSTPKQAPFTNPQVVTAAPETVKEEPVKKEKKKGKPAAKKVQTKKKKK